MTSPLNVSGATEVSATLAGTTLCGCGELGKGAVLHLPWHDRRCRLRGRGLGLQNIVKFKSQRLFQNCLSSLKSMDVSLNSISFHFYFSRRYYSSVNVNGTKNRETMSAGAAIFAWPMAHAPWGSILVGISIISFSDFFFRLFLFLLFYFLCCCCWFHDWMSSFNAHISHPLSNRRQAHEIFPASAARGEKKPRKASKSLEKARRGRTGRKEEWMDEEERERERERVSEKVEKKMRKRSWRTSLLLLQSFHHHSSFNLLWNFLQFPIETAIDEYPACYLLLATL